MARTDTVNVLIVDDDRAIQRMLADALTKQGFTVTVERDGEWALRTFEKRRFDAVLLDVLLPAMNGYDVLAKMRELPQGARTPILLISGVYKSPLHQREAVEKHGAFAFLEKPVRISTLYQTLKEALGERYPAPRKEPPPPPLDDEADSLADRSAEDEVTHVESTARSSGGASGQALRGALSERPFPELLAEIYRWKGSGALLLRRDKVKKIVYFREGTPQFIKSNLLSECLGRVMVREKMISETECEESLKRMKASGRQQGTVLIEMGCISPHNLVYALNLQLQTKLFDVFRWEQGEYQLNPRVELPAETVDLGMTAASVIYEGVRQGFDDARLAKVAGELGPLYVHPSENPLYALQDAGLAPEEQQLLQAVDGHKTVATLRALALLPPGDTDRFLYAMKCAQMVELKPTAASGRPRPSIPAMAALGERPPPLPPPIANPPTLPDARPGRPATLPNHPPEPFSGRQVIAQAAGSLLPELTGVHGALGTEESGLRERLVAKVNELRRMDYFQMLGVEESASREDIKRAYFVLAKEYHPDKHFGSASAEVRHLASQVYEMISTAHDTLSDPQERQRYAKELAQGVKRDVGDDVGKILAAEGKFQRAEERLRERDLRGALALFQEAVALYGEEGEFHAYLGWTVFQLAPDDERNVDGALRSLERAISLNPKLDKSYLFTGHIFKATGRPDKAEKQFEKAIQCNPDCTEALRELRLLGKGRR